MSKNAIVNASVVRGAEAMIGVIIPKTVKSTFMVLRVRHRPESVTSFRACSSLIGARRGMSVPFSVYIEAMSASVNGLQNL